MLSEQGLKTYVTKGSAAEISVARIDRLLSYCSDLDSQRCLSSRVSQRIKT